MWKIEIPFSSKPIVLKVDHQKALSESQLEELDDLVSFLMQELHHSELGSAIRRLNEAELLYPMKLDEHVWEFVNWNFQLQQQHPEVFTPLETEDLQASLSLDANQRVFAKKLPVQLNSSLLLPTFVTHKIQDYLDHEVRLNRYLLEIGGLQLGKGKWTTEWQNPITELMENCDVVDQALSLEINPQAMTGNLEVSSNLLNPFANLEMLSSYVAVIAIAQTPLQAKLIALKALQLGHTSSLAMLAKQNEAQLIMIDNSGESTVIGQLSS